MAAQSLAAIAQQLHPGSAPSTQAAINPNVTSTPAYNFTGLNAERSTYGFTGAGQTVAVIDTGIAYDHPALGGGYGANYRVVGGYDFAANDANPYDDGPLGGHGTHVSGIIASNDVNNPGLATGVDLVGLRVFDSNGNGSFDAVDKALQWVHTNRFAFRNPITTVNLSLGADWNSSTVPNWANLENDFLQLKNDGIFIAVAAGNAFANYGTPGLSYPGASSYVVPVAAVDASGNLAGYSQRLDRVIAAPGSDIRSTAPDYIGNLDGKTNDWITMSGTSMATPYVAGASVLIRQALQFAGYKNINEDTINYVMRNTADSIYDSATNQSYKRLNLQAAINSIIPADEFGNTSSTAYSLGTLVGRTSVSGAITRLDDKDYFSFVAGQSGTVTFTATVDGTMSAKWELAGTAGTTTGNTFSVSVVAGQTYSVGLSTGGGIGHYRLDVASSVAAANWGAVDFKQISGVDLSSGDNWFAATASQAGLFTVQALFAQAGGNIDIELYNANNQLVASGNVNGYGERLDFTATAGQSFFVHVRGSNTDVNFRLTNLVSQNGLNVNVNGTSVNDAFAYTAGAMQTVTVNGVDYQFSSASAKYFTFNGGAGVDAIAITGTAGAETATLRVGSVSVTGAGYSVQASNVQRILLDAGGGNDQVTMYDSLGNDTLDFTPTSAHLYGSGYDLLVRNASTVLAYSSGGGDTANFTDSAGDDQFYGFYGSAGEVGAGYHNIAAGFQYVNAFSTGGNDTAYFYDSPSNDWFLATPTWQRMLSVANQTQTNNFKNVYAYASAGGYDKTYLYDSVGADQFVGLANSAVMSGANYSNTVVGFALVSANASGGNDSTFLHDSAGADTLYMTPTWSAFMDGKVYYQVNNFRNVTVFSYNGGKDTVNFTDSVGDDVLGGSRGAASLTGANFSNSAQGFGIVNATTSAGYDTANFSSVDYVFNLLGKWKSPYAARV